MLRDVHLCAPAVDPSSRTCFKGVSHREIAYSVAYTMLHSIRGKLLRALKDDVNLMSFKARLHFCSLGFVPSYFKPLSRSLDFAPLSAVSFVGIYVELRGLVCVHTLSFVSRKRPKEKQLRRQSSTCKRNRS